MDKKLSESIKEITESVKNLSGYIMSKRLCWCTGICCCIQAAIIVIIFGYVFYIDEPTIIIVCGTILYVLSISVLIISFTHIWKMSRFVILTAGYEKAIQEINRGCDTAEAKMKYTVAVYQHYCQSLTKK